MAAILPLAWVLATGAASAQALPPLEATLRDSRDAPVLLSSYRGKPLILFYADRSSAEQNAQLKRALRERAAARGLAHAAHVVGVANVASYDFWPARGFVLSAVRGVERRDNIHVLLDWKRTLGEGPLRLPESVSSVVLLDAQGRLVQGWSGSVEGPELEHFFEVLGQLLGTTSLGAP